MTMRVPIAKPLLDEAERLAVLEPLTDGWVVQGPRVKAFEALFGDFVGARHAIATSSCTTALHLGLHALGVGPGDEVVVPALTWVATANMVEVCGARPVFCDVDPRTWNLDVHQLEACLSARTRAVIPVHLFGLAADLAAIETLTGPRNIPLLEDAACGFGARISGRHVGTLGAMGCFSFHPRKAITTGEGGMIVTNDDALAELCRSLRDHGALRSRDADAPFLLPDFPHVGFNYRLTDIQAAVGVAQMGKAQTILAGRAHRAARYHDLLSGLSWLRRPETPDGLTHGWQSYVCLFAPEEPTIANCTALNARRNYLMADLEARGVTTRQGTHAVTTLTVFQKKYGVVANDYPGALFGDRLTLALPLYPQMTDEEQDYVVSQLQAAFGG